MPPDGRAKLPAGLSASIRAGATLVAMMGDQSRCRRGVGNIGSTPFSTFKRR